MSWVYATPGSTRLSFTRDKTPNEKFRFLAATTGYRFIAQFGTSASLNITGGGVGEVILPFEYFVGKKQLEVYVLDNTTGFKSPVINEDDYVAAQTAGDVSSPGADLAAGAYVYREITKNQIEINQITPGANPMTTEVVEIWVPHTSIPGISQDRIVVENQTDDIAIQLKGANDGIEFVSPSGIVYLVTVADGGNLLVRPK